MKEKKKQICKELKIKKAKEIEERRKELGDDVIVSSEEAFDGRILYKSAKSICKILEHKWVHYHFYKDRFDLIGITKTCMSLHESKFDDLKKEKD